MMTTKIAKKSKIGDYDGARPDDFGARGGGGERGKPFLQGNWRKLKEVKSEEWKHASPKPLEPTGLVGFIIIIKKILHTAFTSHIKHTHFFKNVSSRNMFFLET